MKKADSLAERLVENLVGTMAVHWVVGSAAQMVDSTVEHWAVMMVVEKAEKWAEQWVVYSVERWADWMVATKAAQMAGAKVAPWAEY